MILHRMTSTARRSTVGTTTRNGLEKRTRLPEQNEPVRVKTQKTTRRSNRLLRRRTQGLPVTTSTVSYHTPPRWGTSARSPSFGVYPVTIWRTRTTRSSIPSWVTPPSSVVDGSVARPFGTVTPGRSFIERKGRKHFPDPKMVGVLVPDL